MARVERPRWRVNEKSFIGHSLVEEGAEVFYTPLDDAKTGITVGVSDNLTPLNDAAQEIVDTQKRDHIDKTKNAGKREAARKVAEQEAEESQADKRSQARKAAAEGAAGDDEIA